MYVVFNDMCSGGRVKIEGRDSVIIKAQDEEDAIETFKRVHGIDPTNTTCECCGPDYVIYTYDTLEEAEEAAW